MWFRRARGAFLRLVQARMAAAISGATLVAAAGALAVLELRWESWWTDGLSLVLGGTGGAMLLFAVSARRPDWVDPEA